LMNDWRNDCSYLVMNSITITVKVIDALVCQKRIVYLKYFEDLVESCTSKREPPDPAK
jgi:hypothetical protein